MAFSTNIKVTGFQLASTEPKYSNRSAAGTQILRTTGIQYYTVQFTLNWNQKDAAEVKQFIAQYSQGKPFAMDLGYYSKYTGTQTAAITATAAAAKGTYQITTANQSLEVGTLVQFTNHTKIYRVIGNTGTQLSIFPSLRSNVVIGEPVKFNNISGSFVLDIDNDFSIPVQSIMTLQLKATEDI